LYKAKREYMNYLKNKKGEQSFGMTDIIPLLNIAWLKSFARSDSCRKAVQSRGWGPLNYRLLDNPNLIPLSSSTTITNSTTNQSENTNTTSNGNNSQTITLSIGGDLSMSFLETLIDEQTKSLGRKLKYEKQQIERKTRPTTSTYSPK
jgi:hypothetical protein